MRRSKYRQNLGWVIDQRVRVDSGDIFHILRSVVRALANLQKSEGRCHGALAPEAAVVQGKARLRYAQVVLITSPGPPSDSTAGAADLQALGEIIYRLVVRKHA